MNNLSSIPTELFLSVVGPVMKFNEVEDVYALGRLCNLKGDSLDNALKRPEVDFDLADLILCKLGAAMLWHCEPLDELYWTLPLEESTNLCALQTCRTPFSRGPNAHGQRYCSNSCRIEAGHAAR